MNLKNPKVIQFHKIQLNRSKSYKKSIKDKIIIRTYMNTLYQMLTNNTNKVVPIIIIVIY